VITVRTTSGFAASPKNKHGTSASNLPDGPVAESRWRQIRRSIARDKFLYLLALPGLLYFLIFRYIPMWGVLVAFQEYSPYYGMGGSPWVGLEHFQRFFSNPDFLLLFRNTMAINLFSLIFFFPLPIMLSLMLNEVRAAAYKKVIQSIVYLPHFLSWVIIAGITFLLFSTE
jgi:putative aldouronate transport system permease protein